ncbi:chemotaxis protein CheD [Aequitasia blattaphilus]|uniref:Probable chemoreceptor glutamine deamidase CheD n=1 Tax=Aequitasia blattaphilus TaxID=2949332 RepID=A0ABT1E9R4_9FIRM|nr:chemotaxis protein CheD [Aequitasia blattaphilus]MCP1102528.1 chemotaxis protein CheD [Aequitasia blattaphilus]MCR8615168.1 chemotaxis protein CheD [Aequitasia blattaphilus]
MNEEVKVGIADMKLLEKEGSLITYALGSCIGISFYDPQIKLASLLHILLPEAQNLSETQVYKFADTGIRKTLKELQLKGGNKRRYLCKLAGGAEMFKLSGNSPVANIGQRNLESVCHILRQEGIYIAAQEVGGNIARTMILEAETGVVRIRTHGVDEILI